MATSRITKEVLYLRHEFSNEERLDMGAKLAEAYNRMAEISDEEKVMKGQIKERVTQAEATIGSLSRNLGSGFTMINVDCIPLWDTPNVGEVSLKRADTGEIAKVRVMSEAERQMDLPLGGELIVMPQAAVEASVEASQENVDAFFGDKEEIPAQENADELEEPEDPFSNPDPEAAMEATKPEHDAEFDGESASPKKSGRPAKVLQGFSKPTNASAIQDF